MANLLEKIHAISLFFQPLELCGESQFRYKSDMGSDGSIKRVRVLFSGRVQGVGFRYTSFCIATPFNLRGYVRNRSDGDVELVAEGSKRELTGFLEEIRKSRLNHHIVREQLSWLTATGEYGKFRISD